MLKLNCCSLDPGTGKMGKCHGLLTAGRSAVTRDPKRHDKQYKKALLGIALQASVGDISYAKRIVQEKVGVDVKHPNPTARKRGHSEPRKHGRVQQLKYGEKVLGFVPSDDCLNFTEEDDDVLIAGFG